MATDYILFVHGVNTRQVGLLPTYADQLFDLIKHSTSSLSRTVKKIALYWGDANKDQERQLLEAYQASPIWEKFWFRQLRETQIMQFAGDAALYLSRYVGAKVAVRLEQEALEGLSNYQPNDRLHLVTHSMGTVILFDMLFSARWDEPGMPGADSVAAIRNAIYGVSPGPMQGIRLGSISTMGSPIGIFSLMDVDQSPQEARNALGNILCTHDITPRLTQLLLGLHQELGTKLPWRNFAHPGDPIAYPLATLLPSMVDSGSQYLDIQDVLTHPADLPDILTEPFSQSLLALLHGGAAHASYWQSKEVALQIAQMIRESAKSLESTEAAKAAANGAKP
jgi:hypothetical protein